MLFFACAWAILLTVCYLTGHNVLHSVADLTPFDRIGDRLVLTLWIGIVVISYAFFALALVTPLSAVVGAAVAVLAIFCASLSRATRAEIAKLKSILSPSLLLCFVAFLLGVAAYAARPIAYYDTGLYHFGSIRWLGRHGALQGLGLINVQFGYASAWFALVAPLNAGPFEARVAALGGGFALLLGLLHLLLCAWRLLGGRARSADWVAIVGYVLCLPFIIYWGMSRSPATDLPVILLTILVAWAITIITGAERFRPATNFSYSSGLIPFLFSAGAVNMKLSAMPLLVITAFFYAMRGKAFVRRALVIGAVTLLILLPLLAHGIVTTGCPLFPVPFLCGNFQWSVGADKGVACSVSILEWARWTGPAPPGANNWNWIVPWLTLGVTAKSTAFLIGSVLLIAVGALVGRTFKRPGLRLIMTGSGGLGLILFLVLRASNVFMVSVLAIVLASWLIRTGGSFARKNWLLAVGLSGMALTFYSAPTLKFGLGYAAVLCGQFMLSRAERIKRFRNDVRDVMSSLKFEPTTQMLSVLLLFVGLSFSARPIATRLEVNKVGEASGEVFGLWLPPALPNPNVVQRRVNDLDYSIPKTGDQCWAAELPCASRELDSDIRLRDPARGITAGFTRDRGSPK